MSISKSSMKLTIKLNKKVKKNQKAVMKIGIYIFQWAVLDQKLSKSSKRGFYFKTFTIISVSSIDTWLFFASYEILIEVWLRLFIYLQFDFHCHF